MSSSAKVGTETGAFFPRSHRYVVPKLELGNEEKTRQEIPVRMKTNEGHLGLIRLFGLAAVLGLACTAIGLYGVIDAAWFSVWGELVDAIVVDFRQDAVGRSDILQFTVEGRQHRTDARGAFGWVWGHSHPRGQRVAVLYDPDHPKDARLAAFGPRFGIPLAMFVFGLVVTTASALAFRRT